MRTAGGGYAATARPEQVDAFRFEAGAARGRRLLAAGEAERAAEALREALALWRGPALAGLEEPFAELERVRLEELRLAATEDRVEADLALGRHASLPAELEPLVRSHPLRERLRAQHMLALYRCGRQAEALASYREARRALDEQLGILPSPRLRELERLILAQEPRLAAPACRTARPARSAPGRRSTARRFGP